MAYRRAAGHGGTGLGGGGESPAARGVSRWIRSQAFLAVALATVIATQGQAPVEASSLVNLDKFYWRLPIATLAPTDPSSPAIMSYIRADSSTSYIALSGGSQNGYWGTPVYNAHVGDPVYNVHKNCTGHIPPEFSAVRIPAGARPDQTADASMVIYDALKGREYGFWHARYDRIKDRWTACGGTVYYMASNGLAGTLRQSNEPRNYGHRGVPPETYAVSYREIQLGVIDHMLRIAVDTTKCHHVFPMAGDECGTYASSAPPEGAIIRIKHSVDLTRLGLSRAALIVARALQTYGAVISDQSSGPAELKLENVVAEGRGWLWQGVLSATSLSKIPLSSYEIVTLGFGK
jgi:hypothetical protein